MEPLTYSDAGRVDEAGQSFKQSKYYCLPKLICKHLEQIPWRAAARIAHKRPAHDQDRFLLAS
jgi:hypothetical protein